jgi:thiazole synthase
MSDQLVIAGRAFNSRLIVGTGKYRSFEEMARAHAASGADMVTVAVRRVNLTDKTKESLLDFINREKISSSKSSATKKLYFRTPTNSSRPQKSSSKKAS